MSEFAPIVTPAIPPESFETLVNLASERLGAEAIAANNDFFAPKENLVKDEAAVWKEGLYTDDGKWMDGWETRRRRTPGHDWCIVRLGAPGIVCGVVVDTAFFRGNYPESCRLEGCSLPDDTILDDLWMAHWFPLVRKSRLQGDVKNRFAVNVPHRVTHVRLRIYPDGGVARLRVHGVVVPEPSARFRNTRRSAESSLTIVMSSQPSLSKSVATPP